MNKEDSIKSKFKQALTSTIKVISEDFQTVVNKNKDTAEKNIDIPELENINDKNEFDVVSLPFKSEEFSVKLIWNKRSTNDAGSTWMRNLLFNIREDVFPE